ncbi:uncharacterized protein LOC132267524 [Cornus florida]|uniref:uncharacterized protein LOC132267524 n=1 Tax=Cornus florida TaxID=4283 RepID=UPI0028970919|nr:uncharacterized protein LOC132267524 [Cornus florida]
MPRLTKNSKAVATDEDLEEGDQLVQAENSAAGPTDELAVLQAQVSSLVDVMGRMGARYNDLHENMSQLSAFILNKPTQASSSNNQESASQPNLSQAARPERAIETSQPWPPVVTLQPGATSSQPVHTLLTWAESYLQPTLAGSNQPPVVGSQPQVPPILNQPPQVMLDRRQLADLLTEEYGLELRGAGRPIYRTPYLEVVDQVEFPRGYKVPDFITFSGEGNQSTVEHIGRFTVQCGEASVSPWLKLRLFPNSLTGAAFSWYIRLPPHSVFNWPQMEELFHNQFYRTETEPTLADLSRLSQLPSESVETFIARFRRARLRCRVPLPEQEYIRLALNGLDFELRKRFE